MHLTSKTVAIAAANNANEAHDAANKNKDHADDKSDGNRKHSVRSKNQQCERNLLSSKLQQTLLLLQLAVFLFTLYEQTI